MVEEYELGASLRAKEKAKSVRAAKKIPAIVYGNGFMNSSIAVDFLAFNKVFQQAGESALINLKIDSDPAVKVLVHDVQANSVSGDIIHVDFYKVNMKEKIKTAIPIVEIGESPAVLELEGALINNRDEVEVECLPGDLIPEIEVDISVLKTLDDVIKVSDLKVPAGIEILDDPEEVVFLIQPPRSDKELAELEEEVKEDVEAVEVEGAKPEEGEAAAEIAEGETAAESSGEKKPAEEKKE